MKFHFSHLNRKEIVYIFSFSYNVESANTSTYLSQSSSGISYAFIITFLISLGIMVLTGDSMELMWSLTNTLQLIFYFGQMNLYFSSNLNEVFYFMRYSNFENPLTDYLKSKLMELWVSFGSSFRKDVNNDVNSNLLLVNSIDKLFALILNIAIAVSFAIWYKKRSTASTKWSRFLQKIDLKYRYESITRFFIESVLVVSVSCLINILFGSFADAFNGMSYIVSWFMLLVYLFMIAYFIAYPMLNYQEIIENPNLHERHRIIFHEFKKSNIKCLLFYAYFLIRRLSLSILFVWLYDFPHCQCPWISFIWMLVWFYHILFKPFHCYLQNLLWCINETVLLSLSFMLPIWKKSF